MRCAWGIFVILTFFVLGCEEQTIQKSDDSLITLSQLLSNGSEETLVNSFWNCGLLSTLYLYDNKNGYADYILGLTGPFIWSQVGSNEITFSSSAGSGKAHNIEFSSDNTTMTFAVTLDSTPTETRNEACTKIPIDGDYIAVGNFLLSFEKGSFDTSSCQEWSEIVLISDVSEGETQKISAAINLPNLDITTELVGPFSSKMGSVSILQGTIEKGGDEGFVTMKIQYGTSRKTGEFTASGTLEYPLIDKDGLSEYSTCSLSFSGSKTEGAPEVRTSPTPNSLIKINYVTTYQVEESVYGDSISTQIVSLNNNTIWQLDVDGFKYAYKDEVAICDGDITNLTTSLYNKNSHKAAQIKGEAITGCTEEQKYRVSEIGRNHLILEGGIGIKVASVFDEFSDYQEGDMIIFTKGPKLINVTRGTKNTSSTIEQIK